MRLRLCKRIVSNSFMLQMYLLLGLQKNKNHSGPMNTNANIFIQSNIKHNNLLHIPTYQYCTHFKIKL